MHLILDEQIQIADARIRKEFNDGAIAELAQSIASKGLMNPVTVRKAGAHVVLVAGENRIRAIRKLHAEKVRFFCNSVPVPPNHIPALYINELDPILALEAELEENTKRRDLTWQECAEARKKLFELRKVQAEAEGRAYTLNDLSKELEVAGADSTSTRNLQREMVVAQFLDRPGVREAKTLKDALGAVKKHTEGFLMEALGETLTEAAVKTEHTFIEGDALVELTRLPGGLFSCICTDPPYGIGIQDAGSMVANAHHYNDSPEVLEGILDVAPQELFRIAAPQAHLYWFCDFRWFAAIKEALEGAGWSVHYRPMIWWKRGKAMAPDIVRLPKSEYECIVFANKGGKPLLRVSGDVISTTYGSDLLQAEKPKELYCDLISRSALPGERIIDPFCGSGVIFSAADELRLSATGIEMDPARADFARIRASGL